jgi:hypothetical protein
MALLTTAVLVAGCGKTEPTVSNPVTEAAKPAEEPKKEAVNVNVPPPSGPMCQSCAMPMAKAEDFGTNADKTQSTEYCTHCYQNGAFTSDMTCEQMIDFCTGIMVSKMNMPEAQARDMMKNSIPQLKRWQKPAESK